jgi:hypothetical protein
MGSTKLTEYQLNKLRPLEEKLKTAIRSGDTENSIEITAEIQSLFPAEWRRHHRLLRAKLWTFEACLDAHRVSYAQNGFVGVRKLAAKNTRLYLEASSLLAVCYLRTKNTSEAKKLIKEVIEKINKISSDRTRHQIQKRANWYK